MNVTRLMLFIALMVVGVTGAAAQNSTAAPLSSAKEGGVAGDPNGAIRSLGGVDDDGTRSGKSVVVTVPDSGNGGPSRTGGAPMGTRSDDSPPH